MAAKLSMASVILLVLSAVFLFLAIFFFLLFNIPSVISDLSGRTAKRSISKLRAANEKSSSKFYGSSDQNKARGKLTDRIEKPAKGDSAEKPDKKNASKYGKKKDLVFATMDDRPETGLLSENRRQEASTSQATTALNPEDATDELFPRERQSGTTTDLLVADPTTKKTVRRTGGIKLSLLDEVIQIHTDEVIS